MFDRAIIIIDALAGAVHAVLTIIVGYPFDLVKSRMQAGLCSNGFDCVKKTLKHEGIKGLYRGSSMPLVSHMLKRPVQYPIAEWMKNEMNKSNSVFYNYIIGAANGLASPIIGTPLQVVKISMQTSVSKIDTVQINKNSWYYIKYNYKQNGFMGFYRGFIPTIVKDTVFSMSFIGTYYSMRDRFGTDTWQQNFMNGCIAHSLTWYMFIPIDYVKTIIQKSESKIGIRQVVYDSYNKHGLRVFWKGVIPACLRTVPVSGLAMSGYEYTRWVLGNDSNKETK